MKTLDLYLNNRRIVEKKRIQKLANGIKNTIRADPIKTRVTALFLVLPINAIKKIAMLKIAVR